MPSNLAIDDKLLAEAQRVGRHKTKKETVSAALSEYVARRKQLRILELFGLGGTQNRPVESVI